MGKKRKKADPSAPPPTAEELARREAQRAKQAEALALRAAGKEFVSTARKRKPLEKRKEEKRRAERKAENAARRRSVQKEVKRQRAAAPGVVIVPIFWKGEAKQMAKVLSVCADAQAALQAAGRDATLDGGHKYTPGQKFAHWEHKGVTLRVEVGPREAERGLCTLARTFTPGAPAYRLQRVSMDQLLASLARLEALRAPPGEGDDGAADSDGGDSDGGGGEAAASGQRRQQQQPPQQQQQQGGSARGARGGDDLDDDFAIGLDAGAADSGEQEEERDETRKKKKKKKKAKVEDTGMEGEKKAVTGSQAGKKRAAVVTF